MDIARSMLLFRTKLLTSFRSNNAIALTFDDGPDPDSTPQLLEMLRRHGARATFFVLGRQAELYPRVLREIIDAGSEVANHSYGHPSFSALPPAQRLSEIRGCERAVGNICKRYFRPPYGHARRLTPLLASMLGYTTVGWSAEARDWEVADPAAIARALEEAATPGSIVLLHDRLENAKDTRAFDRKGMLAGLDLFLGRFALTYSFQTISEMSTTCEAVYAEAWDANLNRAELETVRRDLSGLIKNPG